MAGYELAVSEVKLIAKRDIHANAKDHNFLVSSGETLDMLAWSKSKSSWMAQNRHGERGFVPREYVTLRCPFEDKPWFCRAPKDEVERALSYIHDLPIGSFVICQFEPHPFTYDLAVVKSCGLMEYSQFDCMNGVSLELGLTNNQFKSVKEMIIELSQPAGSIIIGVRLTFHAAQIMRRASNEMDKNELTDFKDSKNFGFGEVTRASWKGLQVAHKSLKTKNCDIPGSRNEFQKEIKLLLSLEHKNILYLLAKNTSEHDAFFVTEYAAYGSLHHYMSKAENPIGRFSLTTLLNMAAQMAHGMAYISSKDIVHGDLAARNVLVYAVTPDHVLKIADFGMARKVRKGEKYILPNNMSRLWHGPEGFTQEFTVKSDVFSYGVVLWEIFTYCREAPCVSDGKNPKDMRTHIDVHERIIKGTRPPCPDALQDAQDIYYMMKKKCWNKEAEKRDSFENLYRYFLEYEVEEAHSTFNNPTKNKLKEKYVAENIEGDTDSIRSFPMLQTPASTRGRVDPTTAPVAAACTAEQSLSPSSPPAIPATTYSPSGREGLVNTLTTVNSSMDIVKPDIIDYKLSAEAAGHRSLKSVYGTHLRAYETELKADVMQGPPSAGENWYVQDNGGKVVIKSIYCPGRFLRSHPNGEVDLSMGMPTESEFWKPFKNNDGSWSFASFHGQWLTASKDGSVTSAKNCAAEAHFWMASWNDIGNLYHLSAEAQGCKRLKSMHGTYLRAEETILKVHMVPGPASAWECWYVQSHGGKVVIKAIHCPGRFLRVHPNGEVGLTMDSPTESEFWKPCKNHDGSWSFASFHGLWLTASKDGSVTSAKNCAAEAHFWMDLWSTESCSI